MSSVVRLRVWGSQPDDDDGGIFWPAPDDAYAVAERVVSQAKQADRPLCYWSGLWFAWSGTHYKRISVEDFRDYLNDLLGHASYIGASGNQLRWKPNTKKLNDVIDAARGLVKLPDGTGAAMWLDGRDELVIPCANGLLKLADRTLMPHTPDYFNIMVLPYEYDPTVTAPRWMRFLDEVFRADTESVALLGQWFGYVLSGRTDLQKMLVIIGPKRGGKGTIARLMKQLVGPNAYAGIKTDDLRDNFVLQNLVDKSVVAFPDERQVGAPDGKRLVQFILQATGEDDVQVKMKYKTAWNGRLPMRVLYIGNEMPVLPDASGAVLSRLRTIETLVTFAGREDRDLDATLAGELPGILNWALDGLDDLQESGDLIQPGSGCALIEDTDQYSNMTRGFLQERCVFGNDKDTLCIDLWRAFDTWCRTNGIEGHRSSAWFGRTLRPAMRDLAPGVDFERRQHDSEPGRPTYYHGIALRQTPSGLTLR